MLTSRVPASVTAAQHFDLSKILLAVYNPRIPRLGPSHRAATKRIEVRLAALFEELRLGNNLLTEYVGRSKFDCKTALWHCNLKSSGTSSNEHSVYGYCNVRRA